MIRLVFAFALAAAAPALSFAEEAPPARAPGENAAPATAAPKPARDLAKALTSEAAWDEILDSYAISLSMQMSAALDAEGEAPPEDLQEKVRAELGDAVRYDQAVELQATALALRFSPGELTELERFYRSTAGKKLVALLPEVSRDVNDEVRVRLSRRIPTIVERHAPSLAERGEAPSEKTKGARPPGQDPSPKAQGRKPPAGAAPPRQ